MKKITVDGNEACSTTSYLFTEVAGIYPITPSSPMAEHLDEWSSAERENLFHDQVKVVEMQSEAGAAGFVHGSLQAGCLTSTYTASQGLLLMIPNMYKMAGEMLPCVMHVAARSLSTHALSIFGDHQDIYATRSTGFCMLSSSSVQDAAHLAGVAHLAAIESGLPFLHFFDGFRTSHEIQKIDILTAEEWEPLLNRKALQAFRDKALNPHYPKTMGTAQNDDIYFQSMEVRNPYYLKVPDIVKSYMEKVNRIAGTQYAPFVYYGDPCADRVIVAMGSVCETIRETIDDLSSKGYSIGLIEVHLYRPFSAQYLTEVLPETVKYMAVLDRTKEAGSQGEPLYLDIVSALQDRTIDIVGGRYGLSSKNTTPAQIKAVYDMLVHPVHNFTIGIEDDVTHLSLPLENYHIENAHEFLFYGYGSDGMVSAAKSLIKLIGNQTDQYVQGYFQYDSKKSGGVTKSHLRFSEKPIRSTYYVENPSLIVVTKDSYLDIFDCLSSLADGGIFVLNTIKSKAEIIESLDNYHRALLQNKKAKFYIINAYELARKVGLKNKISTIMESVIAKLSGLVDYELAKREMKTYAKNRYFKKGESVVQANYDAIDQAETYLVEVNLPKEELSVPALEVPDSVFWAMEKRMGERLPVSAFQNHPNGEFEPGTSQLEKRGISDVVPCWIKENCIECNQCALVCPHGVIRPFLLSQEEYDKAPDIVKKRCKNAMGKDLEKYYFCLGISVKDCTGCKVCIHTCPGLKGEKALISSTLETELRNDEQAVFDYLETNIADKKLISSNTIKGCQFAEARFQYSGACAGCGETSYIKLLTQLFGDSLIIANATGCSSIYGGSAPITPYTVPWASSLFEDNAEYGFGMLQATNTIRHRIAEIMNREKNNENQPLFEKWLANPDDYQVTEEVYRKLTDDIPEDLKALKEYIPSRTFWAIGGDGWAYDIGFGGIDHVLAGNENINILVLDSQVYSNTGGQSSKASPKGSIAAFTASGKKTNKKDLARVALSYPHVYVAQVSLGANPIQVIKVMKEAAAYPGPSLIIAYSPCISHGIEGGMEHSIEMEKLAADCGYFPIFHYDPVDHKLTLDTKNVDFDRYDEFLNRQTRYSMLAKINPEKGRELLEENKKAAQERYAYYEKLSKEV